MDIIQQAVFRAVRKATGAKTTQVPMQSAAALARMKAEAGNPQIDMYQFSGGQEDAAKKQGLTQPLTGVTQAGANSRRPEGSGRPLGDLGGDRRRHRLSQGQDRDAAEELQGFPQAGIQGPRRLSRPSPTVTAWTSSSCWRKAHGGGENNIEPGFEALKKIKGETIFKAASDLPTLFGQGDIWIMPYDTGNTFKVQQSGLPVAFATPEEGSPAVFITACVAKGAKNADMANAAIDYMLRPEAQIEIARTMRWTASNPDTKLPADLVGEVPSVSQLGASSIVQPINEKRAEWTERWNREIAATVVGTTCTPEASLRSRRAPAVVPILIFAPCLDRLSGTLHLAAGFAACDQRFRQSDISPVDPLRTLSR